MRDKKVPWSQNEERYDCLVMGHEVIMCALKLSSKLIHFVVNLHCFHCSRDMYVKTLNMF